MKIHEYQAKEIFSRKGIPIPAGKVAHKAEEAPGIADKLRGKVVIKAQVHAGGRGKAGGVRLAGNAHEVKKYASKILHKPLKGLMVNKILIEKAVEYQKQFYIGFTVDRRLKKNTLIFTTEGGIDVEELALRKPGAVLKAVVRPAEGIKEEDLETIVKESGLDPANRVVLRDIITRLYEIYKELDCELIEINPLVLTRKNKLAALDAKITIDDNALFRQEEIAAWQEESETDEIELEAHRRKIAYVRLTGETGIIGNGAGLVMATMDEVERAGGRPANFLDIGGGAKSDLVRNALEIILMDPRVKGIFINIFGGITRCDEVSRGIIKTYSEKDIDLPVVIRLAGTRAEEGKALLTATKLIPAGSMQDGAQKILEAIGAKR